jgi:beta-galactosidase
VGRVSGTETTDEFITPEFTTPAENTPSTTPEWKNTYLWRTQSVYHTTKIHPSVVMFSLGYKAQNGICLYESYLAMKGIKNEKRPIVYPDAGGEWNSDM